MNEFEWWSLIVGLVVGGTVVGLLTTTFARRDDDLEADEREAEATFIASHLTGGGTPVDRELVVRVLDAHREYLGLPAPIAIVPAEGEPGEDGPAEGQPAETPMTRPTP